MGGFECSDQLNAWGNRLDLLTTTHHLAKLKEDYELLLQQNIRTVREGIRWSYVEQTPYNYDFSTVKLMIKQGQLSGIQQIWDICHFGFPDDLSPLHPHFSNRFTAVCAAFVKFHKKEFPEIPLIVTPINEVSFISWLGGEDGKTTPYTTGNGWQVKYALMKAYIQGIYAMKAIDPDILILTTEPIVNMVPGQLATEEEELYALKVHEEQYQAMDILCGYMCPELGGSPDLIDILGFNYYYNNQWVVGFKEFLPWVNENNDPRWKPLSELITDAYKRYDKPVILSETSHSGEDRALWLSFITDECIKILEAGIPFWGICLYPIIDRPDWDDLTNWHHSGLWDQQIGGNNFSLRILNEPYAAALASSQAMINNHVLNPLML
jgi:hypothetical protein